jgi:hypothetical protein
LPAACRQHVFAKRLLFRRNVSASCRDEQAGSLRSPERVRVRASKQKMPDGLGPSGILICRSAAKTELCVTVSEFFKPRFLSIPRA